MNDNNLNSIQFGALARAGEGLTQWKAVVMLFLAILVFCFLIFLAQLAALNIGGGIGMVLSIVLLLIAAVFMMGGSSAVGVLLMDKARNVPTRSLSDAVMFGLGSVPKFLLLAVVIVLAVLAFALVAALVYFVCKIPYLGALLAFFAHPVLVLVAAAAIIAFVWVIFPLFAPAVWSGLGFKDALASVFVIARTRLVQVVLMILMLYIVMVVIGMLLISGLMPAGAILSTFAAKIMGGGGSYGGYGGFMGTAAMLGLSSGGFVGAMLGMGLLSAMAFAMIGLVATMGMNLVYLQASAGLDLNQSSDELDNAFGAFKERARDAADMAKAGAERAKQATTDRIQAAAQAREESAAREAAEKQARAEMDAAKARSDAAQRAAADDLRAAQARAEQQVASAPAAAASSTPSAAPIVAAGAIALGAAASTSASAAGETPASTTAGAYSAVPPGNHDSATKPCKACGHLIGANDMFCELCGTKQ